MTLEWMGLLATSKFYSCIFSRVEVSQEYIFHFKSNEGGRTVTFINWLYIFLSFNEKISF
jgi:hypothetical protein